MAKLLQVTPNLWMLNLGTVNAYLLRSSDGLILIDTGWPGKADDIFRLVREAGHDPTHIRHIVLTHGHIDHAGSAAELLKRTGARCYAHAGDLDLIRAGHAEHPGTTVTPGLVPRLVYLFFIKPGGDRYPPFQVDEVLSDGQPLPMAPGVQVIHAPGHSAGHIALLLRNEGLLIAGDLCSNVMGLGYSVINEDRALARESILRAAEHAFDRAVFGHGSPLQKQASQQLREHFASATLP